MSCFDYSKDPNCKGWELSSSIDNDIIDRFNGEAFDIAGAPINVFRLLGIHQQGQLIDLAEEGIPLTAGTANGYNVESAFSDCDSFWRSKQQGSEVIASAYLGYNFGIPRLVNGRNRYADDDIRNQKLITTIVIQQSSNPNRRVTKARVERSMDNQTWYGVDIIELPNTDQPERVSFRKTAEAGYWRIRPITFTGGDTDFWEVKSLQLMDYEETNLFDVQDDYGWVENRDREYSTELVTIKGYYDLFERETELTLYGYQINGGGFYITANFNNVVNRVGRPLVIGDVLELPSETQYDPNMTPIKKYLEVTDVSWSAEGYTPGWRPTMVRIIAEPMLASQETQDIIGDLTHIVDSSGLITTDNSKYSELATKQSDRVMAKSKSDVQESGADSSSIRHFDEDEVAEYDEHNVNVNKLNIPNQALFTEDALPPNGLPYTEGVSFPENPKDKDFHRIIYEGSAGDIPARLYRYSLKKGRWVFMESDKKHQYDGVKPVVQDYKQHANAIPSKMVGKKGKK